MANCLEGCWVFEFPHPEVSCPKIDGGGCRTVCVGLSTPRLDRGSFTSGCS